MHETSTRSPTLTVLTPAPTASTVPTASWPRIRPSVTAGTSPLRMCRSVPQMVTASTRTIASVSLTIVGLGTSSHAFWPGPWYTSAFMADLLVVLTSTMSQTSSDRVEAKVTLRGDVRTPCRPAGRRSEEFARQSIRTRPAGGASLTMTGKATCSLLVAAGDNAERITSEAAFAHLCGAAPIHASSGKTVRHRLNRGGNRQANDALWRIVLTRMSSDPRTRAYVERRTLEGRSNPRSCASSSATSPARYAATSPASSAHHRSGGPDPRNARRRRQS